MCIVPVAQASVSIEGTRLIYPSSEREITIKMTNEGTAPALVQMWTDRGDPATQPQNADAPFLITPPIFRIEPSKGQSVRLVFAGEKLPQDRESLFWFNALEIPPANLDTDRSSMQIAVRSRLKLFYRPANLPGDAASAAYQVTWQWVSAKGNGYALRATNSSPYFVTYSKLELQVQGKKHNLGTGMIAPFDHLDFPVKGLNSKAANSSLVYRPMNDYGVGAEQTVSIH
ncbi:hypothetical protein BMI79_13790 [Serratia oryzae]|uniref:Molecular chaperone n=1 Tax=Serratia oryzae TaxID=2034155 RepID=A0A1S8CJC2_9GAMM|nr:hypothetical protein BMI79_13790 [Serratia oryzae]